MKSMFRHLFPYKDNITEKTAPNLKPTTELQSSSSLAGRVLTRTSTRLSSHQLIAPPDGGAVAWTQAVMGHLALFNSWGLLNSYGAFQTYYQSELGVSQSSISWIGSVQVFIVFVLGVFSGRAVDAGYFWQTFGTGCVLQILGVFLTSISKKYWQVFLTQAICTGVGSGLTFCPALAVVTTYFSTRRIIALAITTTGGAMGGIIFPLMVEQLLPKVGFGWTVRILGFVMLGLTFIIIMFIRPRLPARKSGPLVEWASFKELPYAFFAAGSFFSYWGLYFPFYYIGPFARDQLHLGTSDSFNLLLTMNAVSIASRVLGAYLAQSYFGALNTMNPSIVISAVILYVWISVDDRGSAYGFAIMYGLFAAGLQSLFPASLSSLTADVTKTGVRMGMVLTVISFAVLSGPPLGGFLIERMNGSYLAAQIWAATSMMLGSGLYIAAGVCVGRQKLAVVD